MDDKQIEIKMPVDLNKIKTTFIAGLNIRELIGLSVTFSIAIVLYFILPNISNKIDILMMTICLGIIIVFFKYQNSTIDKLFLPFVETAFFNLKLYKPDNILIEAGVDIKNERRREIGAEKKGASIKNERRDIRAKRRGIKRRENRKKRSKKIFKKAKWEKPKKQEKTIDNWETHFGCEEEL